MKTLQFKWLSVFLIFALVSCEPSSTDDQANEKQPQEEEQVPSDEGNNEEENIEEEEEVEMTAIEFAKYVAKNLKEKSFENWNEFTAEKVYFSPYSYVDTTKTVSLNKSKFNKLFESEKKIIWGTFDGSGEVIKFSIQEYFNRFVKDFDLTAENNQMLKDTIPARGSELNNVKEIFPNSTIIEIHKPASEESMGMDWRSLMLVIEKIEGTWKLKALVHNEWTT
jgi:hypothetical protein